MVEVIKVKRDVAERKQWIFSVEKAHVFCGEWQKVDSETVAKQSLESLLGARVLIDCYLSGERFLIVTDDRDLEGARRKQPGIRGINLKKLLGFLRDIPRSADGWAPSIEILEQFNAKGVGFGTGTEATKA